MKRTLLPLFIAAFLFACGQPAESGDTKDNTMGNDGEMPAHTEGDGHDHATDTSAAHEHGDAVGHDQSEGHSHDDGHEHDAAHDTTKGHAHDDGHEHHEGDGHSH